MSTTNTEHYTTKDLSSEEGGLKHVDDSLSTEDHLQDIQRANSVNMSPELFEKLFLSPQNAIKGDLRKTFANPTPLAVLGLVMALTPFSCDVMGWRGAGGDGAASTGAYYFMGGLLMIIGSIGEWIMGNTYPFVLFGAYGGFWLSFAATLTPSLGAYGHYASSYSDANPSAGLDDPTFAASFGFYLLAMAVLSFIFAVGTLRLNICLMVVEWGLTICFGLLTATFWNLSQGNAAAAGKCLIAGGAFGFIASAGAWWILAAQILAAVQFPISLPVGDMSSVFPAARVKEDNLV
ncbi:gpr1-like plasma membrane protein [Microthyrium microscopicum]|uniref:Gpr1-like plasma membrane protein n=1 Tax=Microthyrium microscopicum TaxID=703497 RepID=A0A6A6UP52_9PEZI|nr:gpr1-like plasma membrane protein [Microthyrium microscopicum]